MYLILFIFGIACWYKARTHWEYFVTVNELEHKSNLYSWLLFEQDDLSSSLNGMAKFYLPFFQVEILDDGDPDISFLKKIIYICITAIWLSLAIMIWYSL